MAAPLVLVKLFALGGTAAAIGAKLKTVAGIPAILPLLGAVGSAVWGWLSKGALMSFLLATVGFIFSQIVQFVSTGTQQILNFNWNQSDSDIESQIQASRIALAAVAGETLGNALGWTVCGAVPGAKIFVFNQALGAEILRNVGEEALDELSGNLRSLAQLALQSLIGGVVLTAYRNNRALFRQARDAIGTTLLFPVGGGDGWKNYVTEAEAEGRAVTFMGGIEEAVEDLPNPLLQAFAEEAYEGFFDGCYEAGYVVSNSIESFFSRDRISKGKTVTVEVKPNRQNNAETYLIQGTEEALVEQLPQMMADLQILGNREFGTVFATPPEERILKKPQARMLEVVMKSVQTPPWKPRTAGGDYRETTIEIPDVKRGITWEQVKLAAGGPNGFTYGPWRSYVTLKNYREFSCPGATEQIAEDRARAFAALSEHEVLFVTNKHEPKEDVRQTNPNLHREPIQVYPAHFTIIAHERILGGQSGRPTTVGILRKQRYLIDLWLTQEPPGTAALINDLFGNQDLNP